MTKLDYFWMTNKDWFHMKPNGVYVVNDDAPEEAKKSYKHYVEQNKRISG